MKKRLNIMFFSLCFLGTVIAETYFIQTDAGDHFSVIALGVVVLITGYLLMDSIRGRILEGSKGIKVYIDQMYLEEKERLNEHYQEVQNLQKAAYTAVKKNTATISEKLEELIDRVDSLEDNQARALQKLGDLQLKALEGQKKALSLEINYNKENTKQLMKTIRETGASVETIELLGRIAERIENNTQVLQQELQLMNIKASETSFKQQLESNWEVNPASEMEELSQTGWDKEVEIEWESEADSLDGITSEENNPVVAEHYKIPDIVPIEDKETIPEAVEAKVQRQEIQPIYEDPNKALSTDEIAALFASFSQ